MEDIKEQSEQLLRVAGQLFSSDSESFNSSLADETAFHI